MISLSFDVATENTSDGALGSWGSAMLSPYSDRPSTTGSLLVNASTLTSLTQSWAVEGYQVNIHAIGDLANRLAINAFEFTYPIICPNESATSCQEKQRFRTEHAQIIHPDDQRRMLDMGIIPSIQPTHATSDMYYAEDRLGHERTVEEAYRMRSLLPLWLVLGSDFPVEPPNPFEGMYSTVTRRSPKTGLGKDGGKEGWYVEEALTIEEALMGFTVAPARAAFLEDKAGVIQEGAFADWVVLDEPLISRDVEDLRSLKVRETWVGGKCVYRRDDEALKDELK
jgi:predicted amidohydrolase YtcJ